MAIAIRPGTLEADRLSVIGLLARHLNPAYDAARFDWLYTKNPAGPGRFWIAFDAATGEAVGTAAAFPDCSVSGGVRSAAGCSVTSASATAIARSGLL